jgi:hypothetical protein
MAIVSTDILLKLATVAGAAGNANTSTPGASLGKYISTTQLSATALNNLFSDITGAQNAASQVDYQCVFIHNNHATLTAQNVVVYGTGDVTGGASWALGVDTTAESAIGSSSAQALTIANSTTAPSGVSFSAPTTDGTGLAVGSIPPGHTRAIWVRRTAANTPAVNNDGFTLDVAFDTAA